MAAGTVHLPTMAEAALLTEAEAVHLADIAAAEDILPVAAALVVAEAIHLAAAVEDTQAGATDNPVLIKHKLKPA